MPLYPFAVITLAKLLSESITNGQDMSDELLEQVRLLSNLETDQHKLLQIVLVGQPELRHMLDKDSLLQLKQRITVRYHLGPITREVSWLWNQSDR